MKKAERKEWDPYWREPVKICGKCGEWRALSHFHKNRTTIDGRVSQCRGCRAIIRRRSYLKNERHKKYWRGRAITDAQWIKRKEYVYRKRRHISKIKLARRRSRIGRAEAFKFRLRYTYGIKYKTVTILKRLDRWGFWPIYYNWKNSNFDIRLSPVVFPIKKGVHKRLADFHVIPAYKMRSINSTKL